MKTHTERQDKRVWIYCRVDCPDNTILMSQQRQMIGYARDQGWDIIGITLEQASGLDFNRRGLKEVMQAVEAEQIDIVLTKSICRIGRHIPWVMAFVDEMDEHGVKLMTADSGGVDFRPLGVVVYCRVGSKRRLRKKMDTGASAKG